MKKAIAFCLLLIICISAFSIINRVYRADPIYGVVLSEAGGAPLENAVVEAVWYSQQPGFHSPGREVFEVQEVLTDSEGRFALPGWKWKFLNRSWSSIDSKQPEVSVYKYGYIPKKIYNNSNEERHGFSIKWGGETKINIVPLVGTPEEKIEKFKDYGYTIYFESPFRGCDWKNTAKMMLELDKQLEEFEKYYADKQKNNKDALPVPESLYTPWYLASSWPPADCFGAIELLTNARKSRNKE